MSTVAVAVAAALAIVSAVAVRAAARSVRRERVSWRISTQARWQPGGQARGQPGRWMLPSPPEAVRAGLLRAGMTTDPATLWAAWLASAAGAALAGFGVGGPGAAVVLLAVAACGPAALLWSRRGRGEALMEAALPALLEAVSRSLRSGASLRQALEEAAPNQGGQLGIELRRVVSEGGQGRPLADALDGLAIRRPLPGVRLAVAALCLGIETGGAQARAVDGVAATLRDRLAVSAELRALSSQARLSALVIGLAPIAFGGLAAATDPRTAHFLFGTGAGLAILVTGLALDGAGWLWMQRLARGGAGG